MRPTLARRAAFFDFSEHLVAALPPSFLDFAGIFVGRCTFGDREARILVKKKASSGLRIGCLILFSKTS